MAPLTGVTLRPCTPTDTLDLLALADAERLPGQPRPTRAMLTDALAGRAGTDQASWGELTPPLADVAQNRQGRTVGAISYALRPADGTGVILWLHCHEDTNMAERLVRHACAYFGHRPIEAFSLATPLTLGLEALPVRHRSGTCKALENAGFNGTRLRRYLHTPLPVRHLPLAPGLRIQQDDADPGARRLRAHHDHRMVAEAVIGRPVQGIGVLWWIGVLPDVRRRGLGRAMLGSALHALSTLGAREAILYVDDDAPPGDPRDRTAANALYDSAGFTEIDQLHCYRRPLG
ncbi:GNAT family N-acetyltransferase [Streptomyces sp. NPDC059175]|uniref:GNAT family N-acetyltransferase n=1 Tax=unclassified Streptomyces TaxID=2593676 RepID=UPI0036823A46